MDKMYGELSLTDRIEQDAPRIGPQGNAEQKLRRAMSDSSAATSASVKEKYHAKEATVKYRSKRDKFILEQIEPLSKILKGLEVDDSDYVRPNKDSIELIETRAVEFPRLSRGTSWAFLWAFLSGAGLLVWWYKYATSILGMGLEVPDMNRLTKLFEWTAAEVGLEPNMQIGAALVAVATLLVMFMVYTVVKILRSFSNLKKAKQVEKDTESYLNEKEREKEETGKLKEHVDNLDTVVSKMKILLAELRAKIDRALLIEDTKSYKDLHSNSQEDVKNAGYLLKETNQLLSVAVSKNGEVTKESVEALLKAEKSTNIYIENLYKVPKDKPFVAGRDIPEEPECEDL